MTEKPILFSGAMVCTILDGRKTQTRRVVKPQPKPGLTPNGRIVSDTCPGSKYHAGCVIWADALVPNNIRQSYARPPYQPGDRLWVRETWGRESDDINDSTYFKATDEAKFAAKGGDILHVIKRWRSSIHMPKSEARIWLEVVSVRVERLQDISEDDAKAESAVHMFASIVSKGALGPLTIAAFARLWDSLAKPGSRWSDNPWVWVIEFKRVTP